MELSAVVTGAARGIGRDVVTRLRAAGYRVIAVDISPDVEAFAASFGASSDTSSGTSSGPGQTTVR